MKNCMATKATVSLQQRCAAASLLFHFHILAGVDLQDVLAAPANKHSTTINISTGVNQGSPGSWSYRTDHALVWQAERNRCCGIQTASIDTGWLVLREQLLISPQPTPLEHFSHIDLASSSPHTLSPDSNYHPGKIISITQINQKRVVSFLCRKPPDFTQMPI